MIYISPSKYYFIKHPSLINEPLQAAGNVSERLMLCRNSNNFGVVNNSTWFSMRCIKCSVDGFRGLVGRGFVVQLPSHVIFWVSVGTERMQHINSLTHGA